ncbi:hypothetical protein BGZ61DRAFT_476838 [Ilyonectria robusta]|uniref:uncharacterized protein n=1 Tax=Ilyonectria robusta TaxID=1079257 RepID=UPI001E8DE8E0|nr:uncharacterized protein BGZ61DRAFT_476838 [Ilyonectria robusta]KAH8706171.1 hypothetical protein BGZ61DRAFT_476838 [Ilyonectria robusta]
MDSFLGYFSPRKQQPPPPPFTEAQSPLKDTALPKEDNVRTPHGFVRRSISAVDSQRGQVANASSPAENDDSIEDDDHPTQPDNVADGDVDMMDAEPAPPSASKYGFLSPQVRRGVMGAEPVPPSAGKYGFLSPQARRSARNSAVHLEQPDADEPVGDDDDAQYTFTGILDHRWTDNAIDVKVAWEEGPATWEPEENLHRDARESLFAYWKSVGGRPLNPVDPDLFVIFAIRKHSRNKKRLLVEWLGYDAKEMTWLPVAAVEETASEVVAEYWKGLKKTK